MQVTINTVDGRSARIEDPYADIALNEIKICIERGRRYAEVLTAEKTKNLVILKNIASITICE